MSAAVTLAHGVGGRTDLPIETVPAVIGASLAVLISIIAVTVLRTTPRRRIAEPGRPLPLGLQRALDGPALRLALRSVTLVAALFVTLVALRGPVAPALNLAPWALYITFWVGLVPVSLLLGPVWRVLNPLRLLHAVIERASGLTPGAGTRPLPSALGWWPAAAWLVLFVWLELVSPNGDEPRVVGTFLVSYALVTLVFALVYGAAWFERGDGFEAYSSLIGRLSPLGRRRSDGRLVLRSPLVGLGQLRDEPGLAAVAVVLMGSTAFDGLTRTRFWQEEVDPTSIPLGTLGLASMIAITGLLYLGAARMAAVLVGAAPVSDPPRVPAPVGASARSVPEAGDDPPPMVVPGAAAAAPADPRRRLAGLFAASLVPIAVGYAVAHYFSLLLLEGQTTWILASDPFRTGADYLGTATRQIDYRTISTTLVAYVQIGAIVLGHMTAVVLAHDRALSLFGPVDARRTQYALGAVMVLFTGLAVFLLVST